ncbi:[Fe-Fe] hydrogenase large subunit C-terminal domain-containing protein [Isachenkonia alkalipeptolytica]|uniref:PAS domain-containing protein n=1 Tax=Isachenkonia alkalipeptolytica TaxID=2565777 RepID=A0AA43XM37_9CLOT|nr:[Fe-Fe] hydrogenase large subunit C-terminal domain-containing protein [Isachenkonia alkalipeptolytica]NBG89283.1 PAS domain-containing protein [Isachenkonia alkalipeptolytica]
MKFINYAKEHCNHCYKCIRVCSPKAISIFETSAEIDQKRCISCGECYVTCEQEALYIIDKVSEAKQAISSSKKVIVSLSPSFSGAFEIDEVGQMVTALKKLGVDRVEETSVGGDLVIEAYEKYLATTEKKNLIATTCPSTNYLIEKYYPKLRENMIPIISPMMSHGKLLKKEYGKDSHVVYIGPCLAKKAEAREMQNRGAVDTVITFVELKEWLEEEGIELQSLTSTSFDKEGSMKGSMIPYKINLERAGADRFEKMLVSGVEKSKEILECLLAGDLEGVFLEVASCERGCTNGTGMPKDDISYYIRRKRSKQYLEEKKVKEGKRRDPLNKLAPYELTKLIYDQSVEIPSYSREEVEGVLGSMGKNKKEDEINCDACGYGTCRAHGESILRGTSRVNMCLPFMRAKAESLKNVIFDHSPNAIFMVDFNYQVKEFNPSSERIFQVASDQMKDQPISKVIAEDLFREVMETKVNTIGKKVEYPQYGVILIANIIYLEDEGVLMAIMTDVTSAEKNKEELERVKGETIHAAQNVIDKQMRVAQEIASLLGETTAETKVTLSKLKEIVLGEGGER